MNSITDLLGLEDNDVIIKSIDIQGQTKILTLETHPTAHFCPICGFRMYSRGIKKRTINHPILQDNYSLVLILKQRRWRCINPDCHYSTNESFKFVNKSRRMSNATEMLIVSSSYYMIIPSTKNRKEVKNSQLPPETDLSHNLIFQSYYLL